ncbi:hypothetical protein N752_00665 [Desulforamulus aquiferis]|nr:hypothetical protein N752_00665 [Desulforamulus aquiferis]
MMREEFEKYMSVKPCPGCKGARLKPEALAVRVGGKNISEVTALSVVEAVKFFVSLDLTQREQLIAKQILKEINERLGFLVNVGLDYLTLGRSAGTFRGRGPAHPAGHPDWLRPDGRPLYTGRAKYWPAPEG